MNSTFEIDETDVKILKALIRDSRSKLKDIANECRLSSTAVKNRIDKMKRSGLIYKNVLNINMEFFEYKIPLLIGVNLDPYFEHEIVKIIKSHVKVAGINKSIGKYDLCMVVFAENINELDELKYLVKKQKGVKNVELNIWSKNYFNFDNIDFIKKED
jgi:DNA-binding Lrp family transcriptional regulator